jgi:pyruvate,water dikinase|tara:strand:+ start:21972 stop:24398 length:2427 start_codon:yes stop_codon:yes gene_type:complete
MKSIKHFSEIRINDIPSVGGKNASLGEMYSSLSSKGIFVPEGFAVTSDGYWKFLRENKLVSEVSDTLAKLDVKNFSNLSTIAKKIRKKIIDASFPEELASEIIEAYNLLVKSSGEEKTYAVRSSATAEDLPNASFAGQQETYLNVKGEANLIKACHRCYASLFTDRAIKYRSDNNFEHMKVGLSIGVQTMVRSDIASSGVMFTIDPDSGFEEVILISGAWGLGENVVQGSVNTDEFLVYKPFLGKVKNPIISHKLGSKNKTMIYSTLSTDDILKPEDAVINTNTSKSKSKEYVLNDEEIIQLANWATIIQKHYKRHMDIEWAKDGQNGRLYVVQARPETVHGKNEHTVFKQYTLTEKGQQLCSGAGLGSKIISGKARILHSPSEISKLKKGDILVTERTDPDWDPVLQKTGAIITDQGGRTSHAAIVAREMGAIAVVGTGDATKKIKNGQMITVSTVKGNTGMVYDGRLNWTEKAIDISSIPKTKTKVMLILAHPDEAFGYSLLPNDGVGLLRMEFIISNSIGIHPMALKHFDKLKDVKAKNKIKDITHLFINKEEFFIHKLAEATAKIAAAFYPKDVIVRMSDLKSNEYANLLGGQQFEPKEENPMIGFRGASRYYHPLYKDAFEMECKAMKMVRNDMGFTNVKLMIPFCRNVAEAEKVIEVMKGSGLKRKENGLELYMMIEIPSNALLAEDFAKYFDGFSIGSNDLTQLTLGADRDSELLSEIFDPFDPAVMQLIKMSLNKAKKTKTHIGLCGQAPSDYPEYTKFLVQNNIDSISFNPDALIKGIENIAKAEKIVVIDYPNHHIDL